MLQREFCLDGHTRRLIFLPDLQVGDKFVRLLSPLTLASVRRLEVWSHSIICPLLFDSSLLDGNISGSYPLESI